MTPPRFAATAVFTLAATLLSVQVAAQGLYIGGDIIGNLVEDGDIEYPNFDNDNDAATPAIDFEGELTWDEGQGGALKIGYGFSNGFRPELEFKNLQNDIDTVEYGQPNPQVERDTGDEVELNMVMTNIWYDFTGPFSVDSVRERVKPYVGAGLGAAGVTFDGENGENNERVFAAQIGGGLNISLNSRFQLDLGYRYIATEKIEFDDVPFEFDYSAHSFSAGLRFALNEPGAKPRPKPAPAPVPNPEPQPTVDGDQDGDGVVDSKDACPNSPTDLVTANGCAVGDISVIKDINFATGSARLRDSQTADLKKIAAAFKLSPNFFIEVQGHTDEVGDSASNLRLSKARALAVKDALVALGVNPKQLVSRGYGETQPLAKNDSASGRAQNRRVSFKVLQQW